jgi:hypothetical protein
MNLTRIQRDRLRLLKERPVVMPAGWTCSKTVDELVALDLAGCWLRANGWNVWRTTRGTAVLRDADEAKAKVKAERNRTGRQRAWAKRRAAKSQQEQNP